MPDSSSRFVPAGVLTLSFLLLALGSFGCKRRSPQGRVDTNSSTSSTARFVPPGAGAATTIALIREKLSGGDPRSAQADALGFGRLVKSILFSILELKPNQAADSIGLRRGGQLVLRASVDREALRRLLTEGQNRLRAAHRSGVPLAGLYRGLPSAFGHVQLSFPVKDSQAFLKRAAGLKALNAPGVMRWARGTAASLPARFEPFEPLKPALMVRHESGWVVACWSRPAKQQVRCRLGYPLFRGGNDSEELGALAKLWRAGGAALPKRVRARLFGSEPMALLLDAEGVALVTDVLSLDRARQELMRVGAKERRKAGDGFARLAGLASRFVQTDSQLFDGCHWVFELSGQSWSSTMRYPLTQRGRKVFAPLMKRVRGQDLFAAQRWRSLFWGPLRQRLDTMYPLRGHYLLSRKEFRFMLRQRGLDALLPILMMVRLWPDLGRSKGIAMDFNRYPEVMKQSGWRSLHVDLQDGDLVWTMRRDPQAKPRPRPTPGKRP